MNNIVFLAKYGSDLSSRETGRGLRKLVMSLVRDGEVVLDFAEVECVAHAFADEFLAVLVGENGEDWFCEHIRVVNHAPPVRAALLDAIAYRLAVVGCPVVPYAALAGGRSQAPVIG